MVARRIAFVLTVMLSAFVFAYSVAWPAGFIEASMPGVGYAVLGIVGLLGAGLAVEVWEMADRVLP